MKNTQVLTLLLAPYTTHASTASLQKALNLIHLRNTTQTAREAVETQNAPKPDAVFAPQVVPVLDFFNEYGCWCYFDDAHGKGHGDAVDAFDNTCATLHKGYECAIMDAEEAGEVDCTPWAIPGDYNLGFDWEECQILNPDSICAAAACSIEIEFSFALYSFAFADLKPAGSNQYSLIDYSHRNGFDAQIECALGLYSEGGKGGGDNYDDSFTEHCCGVYPHRFPYKSYGRDPRACCEAQIYAIGTHQCCLDGSVKTEC